MLEKDFKRIVTKELGNIPRCWFFVKEAASLRGLPDIVGVVEGHFFALELKIKEPNTKVGREVLQNYVLRKIRHYGGYAEFAYPGNWDSILKDLSKFNQSYLH